MVYYPRSKKVIAKENAKEKVRKAKAEPLIRKTPISITLLKKMDGGDKLSDRLLSKLRGHSMHHSLKHMKQMVYPTVAHSEKHTKTQLKMLVYNIWY